MMNNNPHAFESKLMFGNFDIIIIIMTIISNYGTYLH